MPDLGGCRNTIVVLIVGGGEGTISPQDLAAKASTFLNVNTRRVPIYVVALFPEAARGRLAAGRSRPTAAGSITKSRRRWPTRRRRAIRSRKSCAPSTPRCSTPTCRPRRSTRAPSSAHPFGLTADWQVTSPIVGTVNLRGASKIGSSGTPEALPDSETYIFSGTTEVPQRSNVLVTAAFELPGFKGQLRAFRTYKPVADSTKPSGYRFTQDGSRLWVSSTPAAGSRNIYTILPGTTTMIPFDAAHATDLQPHLGVTDAAALIEYIRALPLGADRRLDAGVSRHRRRSIRRRMPTTRRSAKTNKDRRAMDFRRRERRHAARARRAAPASRCGRSFPTTCCRSCAHFAFGESLDSFSYFVDSSPKVADVKVGGKWRTYLFIGQGPGGTFYNTLDVTLADLAESVSPTSTDDSALLSYFSSSDRITWKWSFPRNTSFDPSSDAVR